MADFKINLDQANHYIEKFIDEYGTKASNDALGGTLEKDSLNGALASDKVGSMAWFCWNPNESGGYDRFFMAIEALTSYSTINGVPDPENSSLISPGNTFTYDDEHKDEILNHHKSDVDNLSNGSISKSDVEDFKDNFIEVFDDNTEYPYSFTDTAESNDLEDFTNQDDIEYIAYFFGYSDDAVYGDNKIRLIFAPLDSHGEVITSGSPIFLQKSAPPPPDS